MTTEKGMTLVEVLISILLSSLFFCVLFPMIVKMLIGIDHHQYLLNEKSTMQTAIHSIQDEIRNAKEVKVVSTEEDGSSYLSMIDLVMPTLPLPTTRSIRVVQQGNKCTLLYQNRVLLTGFDYAQVKNIGEYLLLSFIISDVNRESREYSFLIERANIV